MPTLTPTLSPEQIYAKEVKQALTAYADWVNGSLNTWDKLMVAYDQHPSGMNPIVFCEMMIAKGFSCLEFEDLKEVLGLLIEPAETAVQDAYLVKTKFGGLMPPLEVQLSHQQIMDCVDYQISRINYVSDLYLGIIHELPSDDSCKLRDLAIEQVTEYSNNH